MTLLGKAGQVQANFRRLIAGPDFLRAGPHKLLFYGSPGTGKTACALDIAHQVDPQHFATAQYNGKECTVALVREWIDQAQSAPLHGGYACYIIDEMDQAHRDAQALMLSWLDRLHPKTVVIATSNLDLKAFLERLQTRFQQIRFEKVNDADITLLLRQQGIPQVTAEAIADDANGNVRAALLDAKTFADFNPEKLVPA